MCERRLEAPKGYSKERAAAILSSYPETEKANDVRVIVIMNESLADYSLLGKARFEDPLPILHSRVADGSVFEGKLAVSVFGGGTANTEFEFLTGCSTAFLPENSTPYLQYVDHSMKSLVNDFAGKRKIAIHPYYSEEWNRSQVYQFFGFDQFISGVDFGNTIDINGHSVTERPSTNTIHFGEGPHYVRELISDRTCFERIIDENADFTFAVTMQNHGAYAYRGREFKNHEYVTASVRKDREGKRSLQEMLYTNSNITIDEELYEVNQYLTLSNLTDQAFAELIESLKCDKKKTIVLMFGDHQPGIMIPEHYIDCDESVDMYYVVPYFLWVNFGIEFDAPEYISPNFLSAVLKKNAGMSLDGWDQYRLDILKQYPIITTNFVISENGDITDKSNLMGYEYIQYMLMFDK